MIPKSFLFATWEGGGSVAPILTAARRMVERGHDVRVMSDACNRACAEAIGAAFIPWTAAPSRPDRDPASDLVRDWEHEGPEGLAHVVRSLWVGPALDYAHDLMAELRARPADLVVACEMLFGVALGCEAAGQPFCYLAANVPLFPIPGIPPMGPGLTPAESDAERALHAEITQGLVGLFDAGLPALNAARAALGLSPLAHVLDQAQAAQAMLLGTARAFDFAPEVLPPGVRYVGPQLDQPTWAEPWSNPFEAADTRPLLLAGFSTTFQDHAAVLQRLIDAAAALPVRLLVTLGGSVPASALTPAPNCRIVDSAPHDAVMAEAAAVVTHGGHGTVARALTHRLPMLVVPHGRDQSDNAIRVTHRGAGLSLPANAGVDELRAALRRLLDEPGFAAAAKTLGDAVAHETAASPVVEALEALVPAREACCAA